MYEERSDKYVPKVIDGDVVVNGRVVHHVPLESDRFLDTVGCYVSKGSVFRQTASPAEYKKAYNKAVCEELGMPLSSLRKWVNGLWYKTHVAHVKDHQCLFRKRSIDLQKLKIVKENKAILDQALKDGQKNITPILNLLGKTPKEAKEMLGKGLWKSLCGNTFSRNLKIAEKVFSLSYRYPVQFLQGVLKHLQSLPTTLIPHRMSEQFGISVVANTMKGKWKNTAEVGRTVGFVNETVLMFRRVYGHDPDGISKWSLRRIKEEHDRLVLGIHKQKASVDNFQWFENMPHQFPLICGEGEVKAYLLTSEAEIKEEGIAQKHCVGYYAKQAAMGNTLIYSLRDDKSNRCSTVQYNRNENGWYEVQHYAACNQVPSEECLKVVEKLTKMLEEI